MAKAVFRHGEILISDKKVVLEAPKLFSGMEAEFPSEEELAEVDETPGPSLDELRQEAEMFRQQWEAERQEMISQAQAEAAAIVKEAETAAFQEVKRKTDQSQVLRQEAEDQAAKIIADAKAKAQTIQSDADASVANLESEAEKKGFETGHEAGFAEGKAEVERLINRVHTILERTQEKRSEILAETEQQIVDLVLLISRKVIKVISENQRNVVVSNVVQALRKVKGRGDIIIRVNIDDLKLATEHTKDFIKMIEGAKGVTVVEDSSVDRGGCIIDTEFGEIDARISSQLAELEQKILEVSPIKTKARTIPIDEA